MIKCEDKKMYAFVQKLCDAILKNENRFNTIQRGDEEANLDGPTKKAIANFIMEKFSDVVDMVYIGKEVKDNPAIVSYLKAESGKIWSNPDLTVLFKNGEFNTIELKCTKNDEIKGSSLYQVNPNEMVIFIRYGKEFDVAYGPYVNAVDFSKSAFDLRVRPIASFKKLQSSQRKRYSVREVKQAVKNLENMDLYELNALVDDVKNLRKGTIVNKIVTAIMYFCWKKFESMNPEQIKEFGKEIEISYKKSWSKKDVNPASFSFA